MGKNIEIIKTKYMGKPQRGFSEYFFRTDEAREKTSPVPGDRCFMKDGSLWFCWDVGIWTKIGKTFSDNGENNDEDIDNGENNDENIDNGELIADFSGENILNFELNNSMGDDPVYITSLTLEKPLEVNTVYTIVIDEGLESESIEKVFTHYPDGSDLVMAMPADINKYYTVLNPLSENKYMFISMDAQLTGSHTVKILKNSNDMSENYVFRVLEGEKIDFVSLDFEANKKYYIEIADTSNNVLYSRTETFEETMGLVGGSDYDFDRGETYEALSSGEKCTLRIIDPSDNSVLISSSEPIKSRVTLLSGTVQECYCWGNENILMYTTFGT